MKLRRTFLINSDRWNIYTGNSNEIYKLYKKVTKEKDVYFVEGFTFYPQQKIYINNEMPRDRKRKTLRHELTHCFLYEYGLRQFDSYDEEVICDIVANILDFINKFDELF